jgi:hypothetical protein
MTANTTNNAPKNTTKNTICKSGVLGNTTNNFTLILTKNTNGLVSLAAQEHHFRFC